MPVAEGADRVGRPNRGVEELLAGIDGRRPGLDPREALRELAQRRSTESADILARAVLEQRRPPADRALAARALGGRGGLEHRDVLLQVLRVAEPEVVRAAAASLARVGGSDALDALGSLEPGSASARRAVDFAKRVLAHRLGVVTDSSRTPPKPVPVDDGRAVELQADAPGSDALEATTRVLHDRAPMLRFPARSALAISCGQTPVVLRPTDQAVPERLAGRPAVTAVLLAFAPGPREFFIQEYLLTTPDDTSIRLDGLLVSGHPAHAGSVRVSRGGADFEVQTVDARHAPPVRIRGSIDGRSGSVALSGVVDTERRRSESRTPTRSPRPSLNRRG